MTGVIKTDDSFERATLYIYNEKDDKWVKHKVKVQIADKAFASGSERVCYKMNMIDEDGKQIAMVVKMYKMKQSDDAYFNSALTQLIANRYAKDFNKLGTRRQISFVPVHILRLHERGGVLVTVEPELRGKYVKHNDNDGNVDSTDTVAHAFSHFSWERSDRTLLVCDIQGVGDVYTDPAIQSIDPTVDIFGHGNLGMPAIRKFFSTHKCNCLCRALSLSPGDAERHILSRRHSSNDPRPSGTTMPIAVQRTSTGGDNAKAQSIAASVPPSTRFQHAKEARARAVSSF